MSHSNVIITSGSKNQIIHIPVVTSTTRPVTPLERGSANHTVNRKNSQNNTTFYSPTKLNALGQTSSLYKSGASNSEHSNNEDNSEVKTLYIDSEGNHSREQLLLPTDTYIKEEIPDDEYEEYESMDEADIEGIMTAKTQYKCSGCGKGFCYKGWLEKHKQSSPNCRNAHPIQEKVFKEPNNYSPVQNRERPSLEGRLNELLCCPNDNCSFTTHWVQSLNKHVFTACKFAKPENIDTIPLRNNSNKKPQSVCDLCNKGFSDTEQQVVHMRDVHQIKLLYQCSECKMNFKTNYESEVHIEEYHKPRKEKVLPRIPELDNNSVANGSQQYWTCDSCNKTYLSMRSYDIHRESCERSATQSQRTAQTPSLAKSPFSRTHPKNNSMKHFRREQIEAIHTHDYRCRFCQKAFDSSNGLCNHLSRRPLCRDWYYTNLPLELKKKNSLHLMPKNQKRISLQNGVEGSPQSTYTKHSTESSGSGYRSRRPLPRKKSFDCGEDVKTNSARCDRCRKIFVGKNPCVALTNHLRGSTCMPTKYNPSQKPQIVRSRTLNKSLAKGSTTPQPRTLGDNRFFCKLCDKSELKNRVSLGCHLTIYHGLPQVNVSTANGDAFRCQTCSQQFESKYFYNVHRSDCDLTSPYVGVISGDEMSQFRQVKRPSNLNSQQTGPRTPTGVTCGLCGRTGFSSTNQVNIHQKYQCIKRHQTKANQSNVKRFQPPLRTQQKPVVREKQMSSSDKNDTSLTCDQCGRGPYNSYSHFMEHKKKYCNALKGVPLLKTYSRQDIDPSNKAKKSFGVTTLSSNSNSKENFCLNPTVPRARKTINFANVSSPQVSHDSSAPMDTNENEAVEDVIHSMPELTKCSVCPEEFDDILTFIRHRLGHITEELLINESVEPVSCELCGARVLHYQRIQQHLILHLQNVQILKKKNLIEVMKRTVHKKHSDKESDEEEDQNGSVLHCPYCKSEYFSRVELANHIKKTCPFRYQCPNCSNTYSTKESYSSHREYCSKNSNCNKIGSTAPIYKCRNCNVEFKIKQQLLWHEHACSKVYAADHSGRVEEVIERTLTCSVCGLVSDVYELKVKHESQCLKRYLAVIGNTTEEIQTNGEEISKPFTNQMDFDLTSLSNTSKSSEVPEEVINNLKEEFGIKKDLKVVLTGFDEQLLQKLKNQIYGENDETTQFETLKESFMTLVRRLTKNDGILFEMSQESSAEVLLSRMLKYLGEEAIQHNGLNELNCFRQNLQTFLKLTIKDETLVLAYRDAESVDEAIVNMLNFECEFNS